MDSRYHQKEYAGMVEEWLAKSRDRLLERQIDYLLIRMNDPVEKVLRSFLTGRKRLLK